MSRRDLDGRTVLVTGAARGIGAGVARRMHARGANVALIDLRAADVRRVADGLGERAAAFEADVGDRHAVTEAVEEAVSIFGGIDVAVANAGIAHVGSVADSPDEEIDQTFAVNLLGVCHTDRAVLPHVVASRGYILNVASLAAAAHMPLMAAYAASKAGVEAFSDCLRGELRPTGTAVGCAYFGFIQTDLVTESLAHPAGAAAHRLLPGPLGRPVDLKLAVDAIERGIDRRSSRVWAPRYVGSALALRGLLQPTTELFLAARPRRITELIDLAVPTRDASSHKVG